MIKRWTYFILINAGILATISITIGFTSTFLLIPILGSVGSFISLFLSKWLAKKSHKIKMISANNYDSELEAKLYELVREIYGRSDLEKMPEVGVYESNNINAFATGRNKGESMVAFSSSLLREMEWEEIEGVVAHELSHISNGDMVTMTLIQAVINTIVLIFTFPLKIFQIGALFSSDVSYFEYIIVSFFKFIIVMVMTLIGSLISKFFSRRREFRADNKAAKLVGNQKVVKTLKKLGTTTVEISKKQSNYSSLKINGVNRFLDIFSTHPSIDRRINKLDNNNISKVVKDEVDGFEQINNKSVDDQQYKKESGKELDYLEKLEKIAELKEKGVITEEEFKHEKEKIM